MLKVFHKVSIMFYVDFDDEVSNNRVPLLGTLFGDQAAAINVINDVVLNDRPGKTEIAETAEEVRALGRNCWTVPADRDPVRTIGAKRFFVSSSRSKTISKP